MRQVIPIITDGYIPHEVVGRYEFNA